MRFLPIVLLLACWTALSAASSGPALPMVPEQLRGNPAQQVIILPGEYDLACSLLHSYNAGCTSFGETIPTVAEFNRLLTDSAKRGLDWAAPIDAFKDATSDQVAHHDWRVFPLFQDTFQEGNAVKPNGLLVLFVPDGVNAGLLQHRIESLYLARGFKSYPTAKQPEASKELVSMLRDGLGKIYASSGIAQIGWGNYVMIGIGLLLFYLGIAKGFEPLLLVPIAMGCIFVNAIGANMVAIAGPSGTDGGLLYYFFNWGITTGIFPLMIFLGVGALTDFGPMLANPWSMLLGGAAQFGIFGTFVLAAFLPGVDFTLKECGAIAIIGGADGPTSIFVASRLAPDLLGAIAVAAYSYMALVPIIQPPIMKALTTSAERKIMMEQRKPVSKQAKIIFPLVTTLLCALLLPDAVPLIGMLMFGNLLRESGCTERLSKAAQNEIINIVTIMLGLSVGTKLAADKFLDPRTLAIVVLGCIAFMVGTAGGVLMAKVMNKLSGGRINPLIGSAGVSAVPMAARVSQVVGQQYNRQNMLLMHAMGPNVAGVIGSAVAAGILLALLG
jgi:oxaloacetate decarboxylase beta subunit